MRHYGPKMRALTERQREFVKNWVEAGARYGQLADCYRRAGFSSRNASGDARDLLARPHITEALTEYTKMLVRSGLPEYVNAMMAMMRDPAHPGHWKAVDSLMARAGLPTPNANGPLVNISINEGMSLSDLAARARELMAELGGDPTRIPEVIEAEALPAPEETP